MTLKGFNLYESNMYNIEWMRLLGHKARSARLFGGQMELDTYRMRDGKVLVLVEYKKDEKWEVVIYDRADIEERTWVFFDRVDAQKKFTEIKMADRGAKS